ncbi:hypothetical protein NDU88_001692 [Pleurodeles waltl]|uniref:Uncharacterized protein n=1 Tax=Pleurodeles waltl TaxID=8319 RepID=A0AAV7T126_PLEWA|nr:hypothetical protein NDU88_001692 [Pleurodeles waltl]
MFLECLSPCWRNILAQFFMSAQTKDERAANYLASLKNLAWTCEFCELTDSLIRDQLERCTIDPRVQENMFAKDPSLKQAIEKVEGSEHASGWVKEVRGITYRLVDQVSTLPDKVSADKLSIDKVLSSIQMNMLQKTMGGEGAFDYGSGRLNAEKTLNSNVLNVTVLTISQTVVIVFAQKAVFCSYRKRGHFARV